jgi:dUTP pyrophosphatase
MDLTDLMKKLTEAADSLYTEDNGVKIVNKSKHPLPKYQTEGSAGMDLTANLEEPIILKPMERKLIPTGMFIALPIGFEAQIRPRSGMAFKRGLTVINSPGTIDSDYRGELMVAMINMNTEEQTIVDGDRVAQMVIAQYGVVKWDEVETLDETERGEGGFGSTDKKKN